MTDIERRSTVLEVLRRDLAPNAPDEALDYFRKVFERLRLDPWAGQITLIGRYNRQAKDTVWRPQITVAGRRVIAERTGQLAGIEGPEWTGPRNPHGDLDWREVWDDDDNYPYAARCLVYRHDWTRPANGTVKWSEFAQYTTADGEPRLTVMWDRMRSHMLGKVAESLALRRAFPEVAAAVDYVGDDDQATIVEAEATPPAAVTASHPANPAMRAVTRARASFDRVPDHVYDNEPEARGHEPDRPYRYDPDDSGRPFDPNPGERFS